MADPFKPISSHVPKSTGIKDIPVSNIPAPTIISQKDFVNELKKQMGSDDLTALTGASDIEIMNQAFKLYPELKTKVANPELHDAAAAREQQRTLDQIKQNQAFTKSVLDTIPAIGSFAGGMAATPETFGGGTLAGAGLGAAGGGWVRDKIAEYMGIEPQRGLLEETGRMGLEGATAAAWPGIEEVLKRPVKFGAEMIDTFAPRKIKQWILPDVLTKTANQNPFASQYKRASTGTPFDLTPEKPGFVVPEGSIGSEGRAYTEGDFRSVGDKQLGTKIREAPEAYPNVDARAIPETTGPKPLGPANTRFTRQANPNIDILSLESPEAITESKIKASIDAIEHPPIEPPAPSAGRTEEDVLEHYKNTPQTLTETPRMKGKASASIVKKGTTLIIDTDAATADLAKKFREQGFQAVGVDPNGHIIFKLMK